MVNQHPTQRIRASWLFSQFALPRGRLGRLAGVVMARGNADMARRTIALLDPLPTDRVLEIGFGPGAGIQLLVRRVTSGTVAGVDPSTVMLDQARKRNRTALVQGRVDLRQGSAGSIPWPEAHFDRACSINNVMLWDLGHDPREVRRVLRPSGRLVIAVHEWTLHGGGPRLLQLAARFPSLEDVLSALRSAPFQEVTVQREPTRSGPALFIVCTAA